MTTPRSLVPQPEDTRLVDFRKSGDKYVVERTVFRGLAAFSEMVVLTQDEAEKLLGRMQEVLK